MYSYPYPYIPLYINSSINDVEITDDVLYWYPWIPAVKNSRVWIAMAQKWHGKNFPELPPPGYDYYVIMGDSNMFGVAEKIACHTGGQVLQLTGPFVESSFDSDRVKYLPCTFDHQRMHRMPTHWAINKNTRYKASALVGRVTQSKAIIFAALNSMLDSKDFVGSLIHTYQDDKNVHDWSQSGNHVCDRWLQKFLQTWGQQKMFMNNDDQIQSSYNNPAYQESALNFTQESYHYSYMMSDNGSYIEPGPFLTEKTHKCLLSKTAFIAVGQYHTYKWLSSMGLTFDYGGLDLSFDQDPGNLTRLEKIVGVIDSLKQWSAQDLYEMTRPSCEQNYDMIMSQQFWQNCDKYNQYTYEFLTSLC